LAPAPRAPPGWRIQWGTGADRFGDTHLQGPGMHASPRSTRRVGRWLAAAAVLSAVAVGTAAPQAPAQRAPMGEPANRPELKTYKFEFRDKRWTDVLDWFTQISGLQFHSPYKPTGTFTSIAPKLANVQPREYTIPEIVDILNEALLLQKFLLIRREATYTIIPADEKI